MVYRGVFIGVGDIIISVTISIIVLSVYKFFHNTYFKSHILKDLYVKHKYMEVFKDEGLDPIKIQKDFNKIDIELNKKSKTNLDSYEKIIDEFNSKVKHNKKQEKV